MNITGLILGAMSLIIIGIWHPIVIKAEYHLGKKSSAAIFFIVGAVCVAISLFIKNLLISTAVSLFGFSAFWGIKEVYEQDKRVQKGWFPNKSDVKRNARHCSKRT